MVCAASLREDQGDYRDYFGWKEVAAAALELTGLNITTVIDLTDTDRYYDPTDVFRSIGAKHIKVAVPGRQRVPQRLIDRFNDAVSLGTDNGCVVVHCTHGVNRTGFMVINYLLNSSIITSVQQGLDHFACARGYGLSKQYLVDELQLRYPSHPE